MAAWTAIANEIIRNPRLDVFEKAIYGVVKSHMNGTQAAFPGIRTIAREANCSIPSVLRALRSLEVMGLLHSTSQGNGYRMFYSITDQPGLPPTPETDQPGLPPTPITDQPGLPLNGVDRSTSDHNRSTTDTDRSTSDQKPINVVDPKKTIRRLKKKTKEEEVRVLTISEVFILEMIDLHKERWGTQGVKDHIEEAVNYYLPEMRKGKYQNLESCVRGSLRRAIEREDKSGQPSNKNPSRDVSKYFVWPDGRVR